MGIQHSRVRFLDLAGEAAIAVLRSPVRTLLTCLGTALGVAAVTSIVGLSQTAEPGSVLDHGVIGVGLVG
jgi:putative ABC transport system permease protein